MIHLKSYTPTHQQMARVEHAMVVNRRRYYALREAGNLDLKAQVDLDIEYNNLTFFRNQYHGQHNVQERASHSSTLGTSINRPADNYSRESPSVEKLVEIPSYEPTNGVTRANRMPTTARNSKPITTANNYPTGLNDEDYRGVNGS